MPVFVYLSSYSVVQLRGLHLPSNTGLYDGARPGASSRPPRPRREVHAGSRPASLPAERANLTIVAVEVSVQVVEPPQVQYSRDRTRTRTRARGLVGYRGLLCAGAGGGLPHTAACLAGNLLTQL